MINHIQIYCTKETNPYKNLAVEQYLLENVQPETCILYLWQNCRTVVIGRNQNALRECRTTQLEASGGFLARRLSGGGAVFHDLGNLNFTFLVNTEDYNLKRQLSVIVGACRAMDIPAECSGRNDVLSGGRKFSGNAFYKHHGRSYHHGTLLVDVDIGSMNRYLSPSAAKLEAKGVQSVRSRVVNLKELKPDLTIPELTQRLEEAFSMVYGLTAEYLDESSFDQKYIESLTERNSSWEWLYGRDLQCTLTCGNRFSWGELEFRITAAEGKVQQITVYTDSMDWQLAPELERALTGSRMRLEELQARIRSSPLNSGVKEDLCQLLERQDL
ncbi:MAG: lipoate--protein ligase [Oscillospiraceae bacterium]|nr:lipoate--protein ligase [Oscillospiraceae bacterium]